MLGNDLQIEKDRNYMSKFTLGFVLKFYAYKRELAE